MDHKICTLKFFHSYLVRKCCLVLKQGTFSRRKFLFIEHSLLFTDMESYITAFIILVAVWLAVLVSCALLRFFIFPFMARKAWGEAKVRAANNVVRDGPFKGFEFVAKGPVRWDYENLLRYLVIHRICAWHMIQ